MTKKIANHYPEFPSRPTTDASQKGYRSSDYDFPHSDFAFNPVTLGMVERFIFDLTQQNAQDLLCQQEVRLLRVIVGATSQLIKRYREARDGDEDQYDEELKLIQEFRAKAERFTLKLGKLQRENGLQGGSVHYDEQ